MDDFEAIFVCDAVAVPECGGWVDKTGHVMERLQGIWGNNGRRRTEEVAGDKCRRR
jgi:hypothetical protein